jgi:hypothetical protein
MLTGIAKVLRLPLQCAFWRSLASLHLGIAKQLLSVQVTMRERVRQTLATPRLRFPLSRREDWRRAGSVSVTCSNHDAEPRIFRRLMDRLRATTSEWPQSAPCWRWRCENSRLCIKSYTCGAEGNQLHGRTLRRRIGTRKLRIAGNIIDHTSTTPRGRREAGSCAQIRVSQRTLHG